MTREEVVKWLESLKREIGKAENRTLWHYAESIDMAIKVLEDIERWRTWSHTYDNLISRQDAIDALGDEPEVWNDTDAEWAERDAWVMHKVAIESLPSADRPTGWIPVRERLPKEYAQYLVYFKTGECYVYWLEDSDWSRSIIELEEIVAWMPLPEPYKGGDSDG